jgi:hypothetical protein
MSLEDELLKKLVYAVDKEIFDPSKVSPISSHTHSVPAQNSMSMYDTHYKLPRITDILERMTTEDFIIGFERNGDTKILKDRYNLRENEELDGMIHLFAKALVTKFLKQKMFMFQETMIKELEDKINEILLQNNKIGESCLKEPKKVVGI